MTRTIRTIHACLAAFASALAFSTAQAHGYTAGSIEIAHPYSVPTPPGATTGAGYIKELSNKGQSDDRLVGVSTPLADHVELHTMSMDGNIMRMRQVPAIAIPAGGHVDMAPGNGYHLMLVGLKQPLKVGDRIPARLIFEKAGTVDVELNVQERGASAEMHMH